MPYLETPPELADAIADMLGIYGADDIVSGVPGRSSWVMDMAQRIRDAVKHEGTFEGERHMEKFEDRVKAVLAQMQNDTQAGMALLAEGQINQVSQFVSQIMDGLRAELPLTINPILVNGGAVRQYTLKLPGELESGPVGGSAGHPEPYFEISIQAGRSHLGVTMPELALEWRGGVRITIIAEPVLAAKGES